MRLTAHWIDLRRLLHLLCSVFSLDGLHGAESPHNVWTCPWDHGQCPGRLPPSPGLVLQSAPMVQQWQWWMFYRSLTGLKSGEQADKSTALVTLTSRNCWLILVYHLIYTNKTSNGTSNVWAKIKCLWISSLKSIFPARLRNHFIKRMPFITHHMVGIDFGNRGVVLSGMCFAVCQPLLAVILIQN